MKVGELIAYLEEYDEGTKVCICYDQDSIANDYSSITDVCFFEKKSSNVHKVVITSE